MTTIGRRERNKAEKRERIIAAAAELFTRQGFARTTTQQVAAAADVADGTVFRYAGTKPELLLMVINTELAPLLASGRTAAQAASGTEDAIMAAMEPLLDLAERQPGNAGPFLREVLFGEPGPHRDESLTLVDGIIAVLAGLLAPDQPDGAVVDASGHTPPAAPRAMLPEGLTPTDAASWMFSALVAELLRDLVGRTPDADRRAVVRIRVRVLLRGLGVTGPGRGGFHGRDHALAS
ncbi:MAG: TetR/AcrR family transcriptional regulator [Propioniciclava sp.]|uniref:TetR/AcrR family transcriptional regulator n=1 Tax=Propioniciclava sp. TaxID=2038686 RepID=UPI0039E4CA1E